MPITREPHPAKTAHDAEISCWLLCCTDGNVPIPEEFGGGSLPKGRFCFLFAPPHCGDESGIYFSLPAGSHLFSLSPGVLPQELCPRDGGIRIGRLSETLYACVEGLHSLDRMAPSAREPLMRVMTAEFAAAVTPPADGDERSLPLGRRVMRYIDAHPAQSLSLDELARRFFVSKFYLCRSFRAYAGESLHSYRTRRRVEVACRLMAEGDTAASAAWKTGFSDYSTFYRACRKLYGTAPTQLAVRHDNTADRTMMKGRSSR